MKKLMIVAAAIAMAGSAVATQYVYDFTAQLKTTAARNGKSVVTANLGQDKDGNWWYDDATVKEYLDTTKKVGGSTVRTISDSNIANNTAAQNAVLAIVDKYNVKSMGKWCAQLKWYDEGCYRVVGSEKIEAQLVIDSCCGSVKLTNATDKIEWIASSKAVTDLGLFQRFGSIARDKANKVEMYAQATFGTTFNGFLAGQGSMATKNGSDYVSTVSGNIVGLMTAPECEYCCTDPEASYAFDCTTGDTATALPCTAAFGTFRLKINNKLSTF